MKFHIKGKNRSSYKVLKGYTFFFNFLTLLNNMNKENKPKSKLTKIRKRNHSFYKKLAKP